MSKIGRKPIQLGATKVEVKGQEVHYTGKKANGVHVLSKGLEAHVEGDTLTITASKDKSDLGKKALSELNCNWGLHRALLANKIKGATEEFVKSVQIVGLGFKAMAAGKNLVFKLGFSHDIPFELPAGVSVEIDKTGQKVTFKAADKEIVGEVCSRVRALRPPEPYKGTGVKLENEVIARKAGKAKAA